MFVYMIVNSVNGKYYVGQHKGKSLRQYLQKKFYEARQKVSLRSRLYTAIRKYGEGAFSIHPLMSGFQTRAELDKWEQELIAMFRSRDPEVGYNICRGGEGFTGPHSKETQAKMRATRSTPEYRAFAAENCKKNNPALGRISTPEQIKAFRERKQAHPEWRGRGAKALWASLTPEQRAERCARMRAGKKKLSIPM